MCRQIKLLTRLQLLGLFNLNEALHSRDSRRKKRAVLMVCMFILLGVMLAVYAGALSFAYAALDMAEIIPAYLFTVVSLVIFVFTLFKSGEMIFNLKDYEKTVVLPVSSAAIVASRFLSVYLVNLLLSALVVLPGTAVYAWAARPDALFYIFSLAGLLLMPLLPMTVSSLLGVLILAVASRMRRKNLVSLVLYMLLTLGILLLSLRMSVSIGGMTDTQLTAYSAVLLQALATAYPLTSLYTTGLNGSIGSFLIFAGLSVGVFALYVFLVQRAYASVCTALNASAAHRRYTMGTLTQTSPLRALYKKELRRYFSSSIYVMNTCIGGVLMIIAGAAALFANIEQIDAALGTSGLLLQFAPLLLGLMCTISPTTASAVSMEGRQWWLMQSLPISVRPVFNSKLLINLTVMLPCCAVSWILLLIALRPAAAAALWLLLVPVCCTLFMSVAGLSVNLKMPVFNWESETAVVKQSSSTLFTMLAGFGTIAAGAALVYAMPAALLNLAYAVFCLLLLGASAFLYARMGRLRLADIA